MLVRAEILIALLHNPSQNLYMYCANEMILKKSV